MRLRAAICGRRSTPAFAPPPSSSCMAIGTRRTRRQWLQLAREIGFTQVSVSHEVSPLMKLVGRGDTTVVDAYLSPILRRYVDNVAADLGGTRLMFMQSNGGLVDARFFQGKDSILSGPAGGIVGAVETVEAGRLRQDHRLRHGRHLDRRVALRRRVRARLRDQGRGRAHARADDADPHRRGRRRLDPVLRWLALPGRAGVGRRQSRSGLLSSRRPARGHRCQRDARPRAAGFLPARVRAGRRPAARPRHRRREVRGVGGRDRARHRQQARARAGRRRLPHHRRRQHGERHQGNLDPARLRRDGVHALLLRRRRRPACLRRRRPARHDAACSCTRWPACSRPTAWASPICASCASRRSRRSSSRR